MTVDRSVPHEENREAPDLTRRLQRLAPPSPEPDYERLTAYAFARRYVEGKTVADVGWGEIGRGSCLLAGTGRSWSLFRTRPTTPGAGAACTLSRPKNC